MNMTDKDQDKVAYMLSQCANSPKRFGGTESIEMEFQAIVMKELWNYSLSTCWDDPGSISCIRQLLKHYDEAKKDFDKAKRNGEPLKESYHQLPPVVTDNSRIFNPTRD